MADLDALQASINFVADLAKDSLAVQSGQSFLKKAAGYENLLPDLISLISEVKDVPAEAKALQPNDYITLIEGLVERLALPAGHAANVVDASLKLVHDLVETIVPDLEALYSAIKTG